MSIHHVHAGDVRLGLPGDELRAVLGSCVAVTLWHPGKRVGVMSHVLLPRRGASRRPADPIEQDGRFAEDALQLMVDRLRDAGVEPCECTCKIFGGAQVFAGGDSRVGNANVRALKSLLSRAGVAIVSENVEGTGHRVIRFVVETGEVWVSHRQSAIASGGGGNDDQRDGGR